MPPLLAPLRATLRPARHAGLALALGLALCAPLAGAPHVAAAAEDARGPAAGTRLAAQPVRAAGAAVVRMREFPDVNPHLGSGAPLGPSLAIPSPGALPEPPQPGPAALAPAARGEASTGFDPLLASPLPAQNFAGIDDVPRLGTLTPVIPPDVDGAVGPSHILEGLNNNYRVFAKSTATILSTVSITDFWAATGGSGPFDPRTLYDPVQQRWIVAAVSDARTPSSSILVGVSQTSDPTGAWNLFRVLADNAGVDWAESPGVGYNAKWIAVNVNLFTNASDAVAGARCLVLDYTQARAGVLVAQLVNGTGFCSAPVATLTPTEQTLYVPTHLSSASGTYRVDTITGPAAVPVYTVGATRSRGLTWTQPLGAILPQSPPLSGSSACGATPCPIETQDAQIRSTPVLRAGSIWYTQTVGLPAGGTTHTGVQWTRLDAATGTVADGGRLEDPAATGTNGGKWYAYPHVAVNAAGDMVVCYTRFASSEHPGSGYAYHFASDAPGILRDPVIYKAGEDYYHKDFGTTRNRWGGYAKAQVDPSDDNSLWVLTEYAEARTGTDDGPGASNSSRWGTWWARLGPGVTIGPGPTVPEGDSGSTTVQVPVSLNQAMGFDVTVTYQVSDGTATVAGGDYSFTGNSVVIPPGHFSASIPVNILGDRLHEGDETFTVSLVSATGVPLGTPAQATVTIAEDDPLPAVTVSDVTAPEGDAGTTSLTFAISLSNPSAQTVTVAYATADGTAMAADADYVPVSGVATFPPGATSVPVSVTVNGDVVHEPDETFTLNLGTPVNAQLAKAQGVGTIANDDAVARLAIQPTASVLEGDAGTTPVSLTVTLSGPTSTPVTVSWATSDGSAHAGSDYTAASGMLTFPAKSTAPQTIPLAVHGDPAFEPDETFLVKLSVPVGASLDADSAATVTIVNDDGVPVLSIADASAAEGDSGTTTLRFVVSLSTPSAQPVTALVATQDGSATVADGDYVALSGPFTLPALATRDTVRVTVNGDLRCEPNETFSVVLSQVSGAVAGDTVATGTLLNDDDCVPPAVTVLSPNGGELLGTGSVVPLTWSATDAKGVTHVDLELTRDGVTYTPLATGEPNDGHFEWLVTGPAAIAARLRVTAFDAAGNSGSDVSNGPWTIFISDAATQDSPPTEFALTGIAPNPAMGAARIAYALPREAHVRLAVADVTGRTLAVLVDEVRPAGRYEAHWSGAGPRGTAAAGIYFVRFEAGGRTATRRFALTH